MTNKDIEKRYQTAYSHAVPDVFDKVLAECEKEDQQKTILLETPKIIKPMWRKMVSVAAAIAVILSIYISLWSIIISLWAVFASLIGCALSGVLAGIIFALNDNIPSGIAILCTEGYSRK